MGRAYARPRVIRGTRTAPLPLLPSGPGGVCGRPLHGARDLTSIYRSTRVPENRVAGNAERRARIIEDKAYPDMKKRLLYWFAAVLLVISVVLVVWQGSFGL